MLVWNDGAEGGATKKRKVKEVLVCVELSIEKYSNFLRYDQTK